MRGFLEVVRRVNLRHLRRRRLRASLTVAGVTAGVALVFAISLINATLLSSIRSSIRELAGRAEIEVAAPDQTGLPASAVGEVAAVPGVEQAVPVLRATSPLRGPNGTRRVLVLGVTLDFSSLFPASSADLGRLSIEGDLGDGGGLVLSREVARDIGIDIGDQVIGVTPGGPRAISVSGVMSGATLGALNNGSVGVMALPSAQDVFDRSGRVDSIYVVTELEAPVGEVEAAIDKALDGAAVVGPPGERGRGLERTFGGIATLTSLSGTVALFVALFVVYNTMSMSLAERRREIAMAVSFGASRRQIFGAFLAEGAVLGIAASGAGIVAGWALAHLLVARAVEGYQILPVGEIAGVSVTARHVALAVAGGLAVSLAGAFFPARRIMAVSPIEALRPNSAYEWQARGGRKGVVVSLVGGVAGVAAGVAGMFLYGRLPEETWIANAAALCSLAGVTFLLPRVVPALLRLLRPLVVAATGTVGRLSIDALSTNPARTSLTVGALAMTASLVIGTGSALGSYENEVVRRAGYWFGAPVYVEPSSRNAFISDQPLPPRVAKTLRAVEGVKAVYPARYSFLTIEGEQALVYAVPVARAAREGFTEDLSGTGDRADLAADLATGGVVISRYTATRRGLVVGESLTIPTPEGKRSFEVAGVFDDLASFDSMFLEHDVYVKYWQDRKVDRFAILTDEGVSAHEMSERLEATIEEQDIPARVRTKDELIGDVLAQIQGILAVARGLQPAALVVAVLTIANTMFIGVLERRWEFALGRTVGMTASQLGRSVLLEAGIIGLVGGAIAAVFGMLQQAVWITTMEARYTWKIPFSISWDLVALAIVGGALVAAIATLHPRAVAVRAPIIESLRFE